MLRPTTVHPALVELFGPDLAQSDSQGGDNGTLPKSGLSDTSMRGFINDDVVMEDSEAPTSQITPTPRILLPPGKDIKNYSNLSLLQSFQMKTTIVLIFYF